MNSHIVYSFNEFRINPAKRELWRCDKQLKLQPKAFECLAYLIQNRDRAVGHDELISAVWGKVDIGDGVVGQVIGRIRNALGDSAEEQRFIRTITRVGYGWIMPVEELHVDADGKELDHTDIRPVAINGKTATLTRAWNRNSRWLAPVLTIMLLIGLVGWGLLFRSTTSVVASDSGEAALILPVVVDGDNSTGWVRLGVMDLIADRLRAAGQPMVPSETVIALARDLPIDSGSRELSRLISSTGAHLVFSANAEAADDGWRVSVRSLSASTDASFPLLIAFGEADDVLEAARIAADRVALALGRVPAAEPDAQPGLQALLRRSEAAILAQQHEVARELIRTASPELREHPQVRLQLGRADYFSYDLDAARDRFEALLNEFPADRDPELRARSLIGLAAVHFQHGVGDAAEAALKEAERLVGASGEPGIYSTIQHALGVVALGKSDLETARRYLARARRAYSATGDALGLAKLDVNRGVLEALDERPAAALHYFARASEALAVLHDVGTGLLVHLNMIEANLALLKPRAALALEPRLNELLDQTSHPAMRARVHLIRAALLDAVGEVDAAGSVLTELLDATEGKDDLRRVHASAQGVLAEWSLREGDSGRAVRIADEIIVKSAPGHDFLPQERLARAWLTLVRGYLKQGQLSAAAEAEAAMAEWAQRSNAMPPKIYLALAQAEQAAAERRFDDAEAAYEQALALAETGRVPLRLLEVAESFVGWLLQDGPGGIPDPDRALLITDRVASYAEQDYHAAMLQVRLYGALGPRSAWQIALKHARSLAGEREVPSELLAGPVVEHTTAID